MPKNITVSPKANESFPLILVVEDDEDTRLMLKYLLEIWSYQVIEALTGEEALQLAEKAKPDVILMDYNLPMIDGLTATKRIREKQELEDTVIIFVSGYNDSEVRASALAAGGDDYLVKPIDFGVLEASLQKNLMIRNKWSETFVCKAL